MDKIVNLSKRYFKKINKSRDIFMAWKTQSCKDVVNFPKLRPSQ